VIGLALASGLRASEFTHLTVFEVPALPGRRTPIPVTLVLAPPTTKGGRGRSSWIDYDALARVYDYIALARAATVRDSRWLPDDPLHITDPTYEGAGSTGPAAGGPRSPRASGCGCWRRTVAALRGSSSTPGSPNTTPSSTAAGSPTGVASNRSSPSWSRPQPQTQTTAAGDLLLRQPQTPNPPPTATR